MTDRVSTAFIQSNNLKDISKLQVEMSTLNRQISSGQKATDFSELNGSIERVTGVQSKLDRISVYQTNNTSVKLRLQASDKAIDQIQQFASDFRSLLTSQISSSGNNIDFVNEANRRITMIKEQLNTSVEGRYIFSGAKTDTAPLGDVVNAISDPGVLNDGYYQGDNTDISARVSDSLELQYGVKASDPAFHKLIGAIQTAIEGKKMGKSAYLDQAMDMMGEAISGLTQVRSKVNSNLVALDAVNNQHDNAKTYFKQILGEDLDVDIADATIQLQSNQTVLQATFQAFAKISALKLTDYLH